MPRAGSALNPVIRPVMPELDTLRGIAILLVLTFHGFRYDLGSHFGFLHRISPIDSFGHFGVDLFFVLSGFLITGILLDSRPRPDYFKHFYIRRALRILPLFYAVLLLLHPLSRSGILGGRNVGWPFVLISAVYLSNMCAFFGVVNQYAVLWSLAVEEQFYLLWPAVVRVLSRRGVMIVSVALMVTCPILRGLSYKLGYDYTAGYIWLLADQLATGALLAAFSRGWAAERPAMLRCSLLFLFAGIAMFAAGAPFGIFFARSLAGGSLRITAFNFFFAGILAGFLFLGSGPLQWLVRRPVLQFLGYISYGLYLIHMLIFDMVGHFIEYFFPGQSIFASPGLSALRLVGGVGLAILVAFLSRRYFEEYFLKLKTKFAPATPEADQEVRREYVMAAGAN